MRKYSVLRTKNDWLSNYRGQTFNAKLNEEIIKGVISEHAKYKSGNENFVEQLGKKCLVTCIDPKTMELESVGASSLLIDNITGQIVDNLILDNFGLFYKILFRAPQTGIGTTATLTDDTGTDYARAILGNGSNTGFLHGPSATNASIGTQVQMGGGTTSPARDDIAIFIPLPSPPEDDYLDTGEGAYTGAFTITYQADANPTGGSGTVKEAGTFGKWSVASGASTTAQFMLTHDSVSPNVTYTSGKLLRAAYVWVI